MPRLRAVFAVAVLALVFALPLMRLAAAASCHATGTTAPITDSGPHGDATPHHHDEQAPTPGSAHPTGFDCCLPGGGMLVSVRHAALPIPGLIVMARTVAASRLPQGVPPDGLRRPPRSTDIAVTVV